MKKHVLVLFFDQFRYDGIGANGNPYIQTPALDALAAESVRFDRCMTPSPVCVPARLSMLAGQYPARTGNANNNPKLQYEGEGFYATMTRNGYDSCGVGKMHYVWDTLGNIGFKQRYVQEAQQNDDYFKFIKDSPYSHVCDYIGQRGDMYYVPQINQLPPKYHMAQWVGDRSIDFLDECDPEKDNIFLFSSFFHPHPPFAPPAPWNKLYRDYNGIEPAKAKMQYDPCVFAPLLYDRFAMDRLGVSELDLMRLRNYYYACISFGDYQVGRLIAKLKEKGMYDDTLIIMASDHGEMLGDYGTLGKRAMFNGAAHIPFMIKVPGHAPEIRHDACSLVDIAPTVLSWAGIDYDKNEFDGVDLLSERHTEVYSQYDSGINGVYMVADERDKLVYHAKERMYFYFRDNDESESLYKKYEKDEHVVELRKKLDAYIASDRCIPNDKTKYPSFVPFGSTLVDHPFTYEEECSYIPEPYKINRSKPKKNYFD